MRYFFHLAYDGKNYNGWQRQKNTNNTVQEVIEKALFNIFNRKIIVYGCGRTDAGVHASQYVMHINLTKAPDFDLVFRLNKNLPPSIAIFEMILVDENWDSRYDAISRTYDYFIHLDKDPVLINYSSFYEDINLNVDNMQEYVKLIVGRKDFRAVCKQPNFYKHTICDVKACKLYINRDDRRFRFSITSNRFLRGMVRYIVFFMLEVGRGTITLEQFENILKQDDFYKNKVPAYSNGLHLSKIEYPYLEFQEKHQMIKMLKLGLN